MTTVVNIKFEKADVYCGRGSIYGNPYVIGIDGDRATCVKRYKWWFSELLKSGQFKESLKNLKDKKLGCFCEPELCHVRTIAEWIDKNL